MSEALASLNFRDIGGIRLRAGRLRRDMIYRCEGPASFDAAHRAALLGLGIRAICDLRSSFEQESAPNDWCPGLTMLNFDIIADIRAKGAESWSALRLKPNAEGARETMIQNYRAMPAAMLPHLPRLIAVFRAGGVPMLIHCTAGKDRTGVLIALLLGWLGADEEEIRKDYLLSERYGRSPGRSSLSRAFFEHHFGYQPDEMTVHALIGVDPAYFDAALNEVIGKWGSIDAYFEAASLDDTERDALIAALAESD